MKPKLALVFLFIVIAPLAVVGWLGARFARAEQEMIAHRFKQLAVDRLREIDRGIARTLEERKRTLASALAESDPSPEALRALSSRSPIANQFFLLNSENELVYPDPSAELSRDENQFLLRTADLWLRGVIPSASRGETSGKGNAQGPTQGWYAWHWGDGLHLILWRRDAWGNVAGAELNRARLTADIIDALPDTAAGTGGPRYVLVDSGGEPLYQWGSAVGLETGLTPLAALPLSPPLSAWRLEYYPDAALSLPGRGLMFNLTAALLLFFTVTVILAVYFYREQSRQSREALQRVNFTNQVSHELKTPLTNIRMYAELLEDQVDAADEKGRKYLEVILSESQRLSRLIGNVLSFGRKQRNVLSLHPIRGIIDETICAVCDHFGPTLARKGIRIAFDGNVRDAAVFDRDALEQILGNLLSNVEKYARGADTVRIQSRRDDGTVAITVADNGPGVPSGERERIFEPFHRASDKLTDGVAGAGIGLTIARDLARLHGGDVTLEPSASGACFMIVISVQPNLQGESS